MSNHSNKIKIMKKYKHKQTGYVATQCATNYQLLDIPFYTNVPKEIIENSDDWEELLEVKKELGKTFDHAIIYEGDDIFGVLNYHVYPYPKVNSNNIGSIARLMDHSFSIRENAEEFVLMNKPYLSINDVLSLRPWDFIHSKDGLIRKLKEIINKL